VWVRTSSFTITSAVPTLHEFGVPGWLCRGDLPHPVPHEVVETMIAAVDTKGRKITVYGQGYRLARPAMSMI
jgi:hypothetical protein